MSSVSGCSDSRMALSTIANPILTANHPCSQSSSPVRPSDALLAQNRNGVQFDQFVIHYHNHHHRHRNIIEENDRNERSSMKSKEHAEKRSTSRSRGSSARTDASFHSLDDSSAVGQQYRHHFGELKEKKIPSRPASSSSSSRSTSSFVSRLVRQRELSKADSEIQGKSSDLELPSQSSSFSDDRPCFSSRVSDSRCVTASTSTTNNNDLARCRESFRNVSGLHPFSNPAMSSEGSLGNNNHIAEANNSNGSARSRYHRQYVVHNGFGLDSESEEDDANPGFTIISQHRSLFRKILGLFSFLRYLIDSITIVRWFVKLGTAVYCYLLRAHLFDTWLVLSIRSLVFKKRSHLIFWLFPLLLILLLFGAISYSRNSGKMTPLVVPPPPQPVVSTTPQYLSYLTDFVSSSCSYLDGFASWFSSDGGVAEQSPSSDGLSDFDEYRVLRLIREELATTREQDRADADENSKELRNGYSRMEELLLRLEDKVVRLENAHGALSEGIRNCCRNHTEYSEMVERQIFTALSRIFSEDDSDSGSDTAHAESDARWRFGDFKNWIVAQFVTKDNLEIEMEKRAKAGLTSSMRSEIEALSKAVATAVVTEQLESHRTVNQPLSPPLTTEASANSMIDEAFVRGIVKNALQLYNADKTGMADFALESAGGSVVSTRCSETYHVRTAQLSIFGVPLWYIANSPRVAIQPGVHPGECWAFKGNQGYLVIQLAATIHPTAFSVEHISRSLSTTGNIDSAPREFSVFGLQDESSTNGVLLGNYVYDRNGEPLQFFFVKDPNVSSFRFVELQIESNHGNPEYTCLYRFRVHGVITDT